uniref:Arginine vasopressin-induced protein 1 n=1 Tax=Nothobranchius rachovii TaxID=451742 RepID=A0A1A8PM64_9TELE
METGTAPSSSSLLAGPSPLWRLAERRNRKAGAWNIFSDVNLWQLQRLFREAGDEDAEQRAQLIWGQSDEAELAKALIGLRARSRRRGLKTNGREVLGSHWLRAFNHLRIEENLSSSQAEDPADESDFKAEAQRSPDPHTHVSVGASAQETGAKLALKGSQSPAGPFERPNKNSSGLRRGERNPDRYLHRILH